MLSYTKGIPFEAKSKIKGGITHEHEKVLLGFMACLVSAALLTGCGGGGGKGGDKDGDDSKKPAATPSAKVEMKGAPTSTFQIGNKTAKIYALQGPAQNDNFNFVGVERVVYANGAIYHHGEISDGKGKDVTGLFKMPLNGNVVGERTLVAASDPGIGERNLAVCRDMVLFKLKDDGKLALYNGKSLDKSDSKWKDDYDEMVGFADRISPLGNATAEDCAGYVVTLFSDLTRKVTMQNLYHDGGYSSLLPVVG